MAMLPADDVPDTTAHAQIVLAQDRVVLYNRRIETDGDTDVFRIETIQGCRYLVFVTFNALPSPGMRLTVWESDGRTLVGSNDGFRNENTPLELVDALVEFHAERPPPYYVQVQASQPSVTGSYMLGTQRLNIVPGVETRDELGHPSGGATLANAADATADQLPLELIVGQVLAATVTFDAPVAPSAVSLSLNPTAPVITVTRTSAVQYTLVAQGMAGGAYTLNLANTGNLVAAAYTVLVRVSNSSEVSQDGVIQAGNARGVWGFSIESATQAELFRFTGLRPGFALIDVWAERLGSALDAEVEVLHSDGSLLASERDRIGRDPAVSAPVPQDRTVRVVIRGTEASTGLYALRVVEDVDAYEENNRPPRATPGGFGRLRGSIWPRLDLDYYAIQLNAGERVALDIDAREAFGGTLLNARLSLFDPDYRLLAAEDSFLDNRRNVRVVYVVSQSGRYLVLVEDEPRLQTAPTFAYELTIRRDGDVDYDGLWTARDLFRLARQWLRRGPDEVTGDYRCTAADVLLFASRAKEE